MDVPTPEMALLASGARLVRTRANAASSLRPRAAALAHRDRACIRDIAGAMEAITDQAELALIAADLGVYQRGIFLVRTGMVGITVADGSDVQGQRILVVTEPALAEAMTTAAKWEKWSARSDAWLVTDAPTRIVKAYGARAGRWRLPILVGTINAPTLRADGSMLDQPGYDRRTGLLFDPSGVSFPPVPPRPSIGAARQALGLLKELIRTFPFVGGAGGSNAAVALSLILTATVRRTIPTAPMHAFSAPVMGSGKSTLVDLASIIATGRRAGVIAQGKDPAETEKRLGALLLAGDTMICLDNCDAPLGGDFLCQLLTQTVVRTRILGRSEVPELPSNAVITATGNNLVLVGDMTRRALFCQLDPECERPELRTFSSDPMEVAQRTRVQLVVAALTVLRGYIVAGQPKQRDPLGSFETWSRLVRDAMIWLGEADPVDTMDTARDQDPELANIRSVFAEWQRAIGPDEVSTRAIIERATEMFTPLGGDGYAGHDREYRHPDFREALLKVAGNRGAIDSHRLGRWLSAVKGRTVDRQRIVRAGTTDSSPRWQLDRLAAKGG